MFHRAARGQCTTCRTEGERQAALAIGVDLGMTQAQAIGVIAMTEQSAGRG